MPHFMNYRLFCIIFCLYTVTSFAQNELENTKKENSITQDTLLAGQLLDTAQMQIRVGKFDQALLLIDSAGVIYERTVGKESMEYTDYLLFKALFHFYTEEFDICLEFAKRSLDIRITTFGETHLSTARPWHFMGLCYNFKQDYKKALTCHNKALNIQLINLKEGEVLIIDSYGSIGSVYEKIGDYDRAISYLEKSLEIDKKNMENETKNSVVLTTI
ncbi:MAG: tetratricopeptide repeat protein [Saprospiraceae bacterium]